MRKERGKRVKRVFRGGSSGDMVLERGTKPEDKTHVFKSGFEKAKMKPVCSYCGKMFTHSMYSYSSGLFNCCEECSLRRLPADLRGGYFKEASGEKSTRVSEIDQSTQLKQTAVEKVGYKTESVAGYVYFGGKKKRSVHGVKPLEEGVVSKGGGKRGRPAKYHTPLQKQLAKKRYQQERARKAREKK
jgi:hypothetical protein